MPDFYRENTRYKSLYDFAVGAQRKAELIKYGGEAYDTTKMVNMFLSIATEGNREELLKIANEVQSLNATIRHLKSIGENVEQWIGSIASNLKDPDPVED